MADSRFTESTIRVELNSHTRCVELWITAGTTVQHVVLLDERQAAELATDVGTMTDHLADLTDRNECLPLPALAS